MYERKITEVLDGEGNLIERCEVTRLVRCSKGEKEAIRSKREKFHLPKNTPFDDVTAYEKYVSCTPSASEKAIFDAINEYVNNVIDFDF